MKKSIIIVCLMMSCLYAQTQTSEDQNKINLLIDKISVSKTDTNLGNLYLNLLSVYISTNAPEGLKYESEIIDYLQTVHWTEGTANLLTSMGRVEWRSGNFEKALKFHFYAIEIYKQLNQKKDVARLTTFIAQDFADQGNYIDALKYLKDAMYQYNALHQMMDVGSTYLFSAFVYYKMGNEAESSKANFDALAIFDSIGDKYSSAVASSNIAAGFIAAKNYTKALNFYTSVLQVLKDNKDFINLSSMYNSIGTAYLFLGDTVKTIQYYQLSKQTGEEINDPNSIGLAYCSLANVNLLRGKNDTAIEDYLDAVTMFKKVNDNTNLATVYNDLGFVYLKLHNLTQSEIYFYKSIAITDVSTNMPVKMDYYNGIQVIDSLKGNWHGAYTNFRNYVSIHDSIYNEDNARKITKNLMQFEFNKQEAAAKDEQEKKDLRQRIFQIILISAALLLSILLIAVFNRYRFRQKASKVLQEAYDNLKETQQRLLESEKKAAYGEVASRMAHEIQNPLNFVNNFSLISAELAGEFNDLTSDTERSESIQIICSNLNKINEHGNRISEIVKQLQQLGKSESLIEYFEEGKFKSI